VCTAVATLDELGIEASTTTLASTQIDYATLTVTAGWAKVSEARAAAANASGTAVSSGAACQCGHGCVGVGVLLGSVALGWVLGMC
jgi:hypothetical protein